MKKLLLTIGAVITNLITSAQWTQFPGAAQDIACGSATQVVALGGTTVYKYNFTTSAWQQMTYSNTGETYNSVVVGSDGCLIARATSTITAQSNLKKFVNVPAQPYVYNTFNGIANNNISVMDQNYHLCAVQSNALNNIYQWAAGTWTILPGSTSVSAKRVAVGAGTAIYALNWNSSGNNIMMYSGGTWSMLSNSTLYATDISVGDANKILAISGGYLYYRYAGAWYLDATAPVNLIRVSAASDGTVMLLNSAGNIYKNTWNNITCGQTTASPVNTTSAQNMSICSGQSTILTAAGTGTLNWVATAYNTSTISTNVLTTNMSYSVTNTDNGCTSLPTVITVTVNALPSVNNQTITNTTCNGASDGSILIDLNSPNSNSYSWSPNVSTTYSASNLPAGQYTVQITDNNQCFNNFIYNVSQPAPYNVPVNVLANGTILGFGDSYIGSPSFQWVDCNNSNAPIAGATNATFTPTITGNYALTFGYGTCLNTSTCNIVAVTTSGIHENSVLNNITLQPNPASTYFTLCNVVEGTSVNVMDVTGKIIVSSSVIDTNNTMTIETSNLSIGIYVIQLKNNGALAHKKLIVSK